MANLTVDAADVAPVRVIEQITAPADAAITAGQVVRFVVTNGRLTPAAGGTAANARGCGIAVQSATNAGETVTVIRQGIVDLGDALDGMDYDDDVYISDTAGTLADADDGTVDVIVGQVVPGWGATTADKLLRVDL